MAIPTTFSHIAVTCENPAAFEAFYTKHFDMYRGRTIDLGGGNEIVFLRNKKASTSRSSARKRIGQLHGLTATVHTMAGVRHIAFMVDDVDAKLAEMGDDAVVTLGPLEFGDFIEGWKTVWLKDPEGNIVEISQGYKDE